MEKLLLPVMFILLSYISVNAQTPQFAVVRPDGTTSIWSTWDSAYNKAVDNDNIYLPGISLNGVSISKKLNIYGAGYYPDSTIATGATKIVGNISIVKKCTLEGFECTGYISVGDTAANSSSFFRLKTQGFNFGNTGSHFINGCVFSYLVGYANPIYSCLLSITGSNMITNSIIQSSGYFAYLENSVIKNNLFLGSVSSYTVFIVKNCQFSNNIFKPAYGINWGGGYACYPLIGNQFFNNVFTQNSLPENDNNSGIF